MVGRPYNPKDYPNSEERGPYWLLDPNEVEWLKANLETAMNQLQLSPNPAGDGMRVDRIAPGSIWEARGLQQGDIITRINQYTISSPESLAQVRQNLQREAPAQISVLINRAGRQIVRVYRLKQ
jgi:general secretion pathway protein C